MSATSGPQFRRPPHALHTPIHAQACLRYSPLQHLQQLFPALVLRVSMGAWVCALRAVCASCPLHAMATLSPADCEFTVLNRALTVLENSPRADAPAAMVRMLRRCFNGLPRSLNLHQYYSELKVPQDSHGLLAGPLHLACFLACIQTLGSECTTSKEGVKAVIAAGLDQAVWDMFEYQLPPSVLEEGCLLLGDMTLRGMLYVPPSDQFVKFLAIPQMMIQGHLRRVCEMRVAGLLAPLKVMHSITAKTSLHCVLGTSTFPKTWDLLTEYQGSTTWSKWRWLLF